MKELGVKKYQIVAVVDSRTSDICLVQNKKEYDIEEFQAGKTAPPFHVRCRSTIAPASGGTLAERFDRLYADDPVENKSGRTLDEMLKDLEKEVEKIQKKNKLTKYHSKLIDDLSLKWEKISQLKDINDIKAELKEVYYVGNLMDHELFSNLPKSVFIDKHSLARSFAKHGGEFSLSNALLIFDMISKPNYIADNSDKHPDSFLLYKKIENVNTSLMEGVVLPKEDGTFIIHFHRITYRKIEKLEKEGKVLYKDE